MKQSLCYSFFFLLTILSISILAEEIPQLDPNNVPELTTFRVNGNAPKIDGILNDEIWKSPNLDIARVFLQRQQDEGQPATESTLVAVVYDDEALYFAFWAYDSEPDKIDKQLVRRDRHAISDHVTVRLDPYHDHQSGYWFQYSISGVKRDFKLYDDLNSNDSWDAVWYASAKEQPWGWSCEIKIPFNCLRFTEKEEHIWGLNVTRYIPRKDESDWWTFAPTSQKGFVSLFGHLKGLKDIKPSDHLEILPYSVAQLDTKPKTIGNPKGQNSMGNIGVDVKYGISSNLTLDATINPDFGQVELDRPVLNLSTFETFYSERRPFFLEGSDLFSTNFSLFYSRRIGRRPQQGIDDDLFEDYSDRPRATTILGAAKITGKLSSGTSIAFLNAVTQEEKAEYVTTDNQIKEGIVEPSADYSVLRIKQDILGNSNIGGMITLTSQDTYHPAITGGVDWRLYTPSGKWSFSGQTVFSRVDNTNTGYGIDASIRKEAGQHIRGGFGTVIRNPNLEINNLGYQSYNDTRHGWGWVQYRTSDDWWIIRNSWHNINVYASWNFDGVNFNKGWNYNFSTQLINNWSVNGGYSENYDDYDLWETRDNGHWKKPKSWNWWLSIYTDSRKKIIYSINPGSGKNRYGTWWACYFGLELKPMPNMEFSVGTNFKKGNNHIRWAENIDTGTEIQSIFADVDSDEISINVTASIVLTPTLSWQISGQGLIASLDYKNYRQYLGGEEYSAPISGFDSDPDHDRDYNYNALNSTMLVRWEYLPGSTLYLVWTRSRSERRDGINDLLFSRDYRRFFKSGSENYFIIKANYWINM